MVTLLDLEHNYEVAVLIVKLSSTSEGIGSSSGRLVAISDSGDNTCVIARMAMLKLLISWNNGGVQSAGCIATRRDSSCRSCSRMMVVMVLTFLMVD